MATAKKLPSGRWRVQTYDHGERRSFTAETKKEAERLAAIGLEDDKINARRSLTLAEALEAYINTCRAQGYSPSTIREYSARARNSFPDIARKRLRDLTVSDIQTQLDARINTGKAPKTVRNDWFLLKAVLGFYAPEIDLSRVRIARRKKRAKIVFRAGLPADILRFARETWGKDDYYLYCLLILCAGIRPSEAYALFWTHINSALTDMGGAQFATLSIDAAEVRGPDGYTRKEPKTRAGRRLISVPLAVIREIKESTKTDSGRVLTAKPSVINWRWMRTRRALDLPEDMRFYDLRHFYATAVANSGASEDELAARLGHSTAAFSHAVYVELFEDRQAGINGALFKATEAAISDANAHETAHAEKENAQ